MTDANHIQWDLAQQALVNALADVAVLHSATRDTMRHTPSRNRMVMAMNAIDHAIDHLAAARARMPKDALAELSRIGQEYEDPAVERAYIEGLNQ